MELNLSFGASVIDESQNHAVQVDEEAEQVVAQFDHGLLHVRLELTAIVDLCGVKHSHVPHRHLHVPVNIPDCDRKVEQKNEPVHGHQHQHRGQTLANHFWDDPFVEFGAAGSCIYVVTFEIG